MGSMLCFAPILGLTADSKVTDLTEDTAPTTDDLLYTVNDPSGTPASRKATIANLLNLAIKLQSTLQSGATFYVSSGTVNANFTINDLTASQFVVTDSAKTLTSQATINDTDLTSEDFGDFTCDSLEDGCTFDADTVGESELLESMNFVPTGAWDWGGATSLEIPQAAAPTVNAIGEIALDTSMVDFQHSIVYATSTTAGEMYIIAVSSTDYHDISDNDIISYDASTNKFILEANAGGGAFSDASDPIVQNTTGKDVHFGDGAGTLVGKVELGGDADQPQMVIEGFSTQTDSIFIIQNDADTQVFNIENDGTVLSAVGFDCIGAVDCDFGSADVTDMVFTTDSTGDGEITLPNDSVGPAELDSTAGAYDFGGVTSFEIPQAAAPTLDAVGELALDTSMANFQPLLAYATSTANGEMYVIAVSSTEVHDWSDGEFVKYDSATKKFIAGTPAGSGDITDVYNCSTGNCADIAMASGDRLDATSGTLELPQNASPTLDAVGEISLDTSLSAHAPAIAYATSTTQGEMYIVAVSSVDFHDVADNNIVKYDSASNEWKLEADVDTSADTECSGSTTYLDGEGNCDTLNAGTDITADLEEETHVTEHQSGGADEISLAGLAVDADDISGDTSDDDDLDVAAGGTGVSTLTDGGILLGSGTGDVTAMAVLADGSIVVGDGTTDPVALAAFTNSTGDLIHEAGGLEADVSAFTGLLAVSGGSTSEVDAKSELETQIADVADFAEADGDTFTGAHDFGGATSLEIPQATAPTLDAVGEIALDTSMADFQSSIVYATSTTAGEMYVIAVSSTEYHDWADGEFVKYDAATNKFIADTPAGSGDITDVYNCASGDCADIAMASGDRLDATSGTLELPQNAAPTLDAVGEISLDTSMNDFQPLLVYGTSTANGEMYVIAVSSTELHDVADNDTISYDAATNKFLLEAGGGSDTNALKLYSWAGNSTLPTRPQVAEYDGIASNFQQDGSTVSVQGAAFDDSDDECRGVQFIVPEDVDTAGTAEFYTTWYSSHQTSGSVFWYFVWHEVNEGEAWDAALTQDSAASDAVQGTINQLTETTWTETLSNLGWAAEETIFGYFCRDGDGDGGTDDMTGDARVVQFAIGIPRT